MRAACILLRPGLSRQLAPLDFCIVAICRMLGRVPGIPGTTLIFVGPASPAPSTQHANPFQIGYHALVPVQAACILNPLRFKRLSRQIAPLDILWQFAVCSDPCPGNSATIDAYSTSGMWAAWLLERLIDFLGQFIDVMRLLLIHAKR